MPHDHGDMIRRPEAVSRVRRMRSAVLDARGTERVGIDDITGRVLAEPVVAAADVPAFDHATMDGYAFDATDEYPLRIADAGGYPEGEPPGIEAGEAVDIATGAPLPPSANAVLKREEAEVDGGRLSGPPLEPGPHTYEQGSNVHAGEQLFDAGERLSPQDAILLGDIGRETNEVVEPLSVGVLATGSEIHEGRSKDLDSPMLMGLVRSWGHEATYEGTVPDEYERVEATIASLADTSDVVITTGGTSVGHKAYLVRALSDLGEVEFHRVAVRPGKPIALARLPDAVVFAIPGKPIGAHAISSLVMRPFFTGETAALPSLEATFTQDLAIGPEGFEYAIPVILEDDEAQPMGHVDSPISVYEDTFDPSVLSSTTRGTRAVGVVIALGDMPLVSPGTVNALLSTYTAGRWNALAAACDGTRGNSVLFDAACFDDPIHASGDVGGRELLVDTDEAALVDMVVKNPDGTDLGSLDVSGPPYRLSEDEIVPRLRETVAETEKEIEELYG
ncbi:MAG: molybdopterin-binding protein [Halapricum sp.]